MKWVFEISDCPENVYFPVKALQINDSGVKRGPVYLKIEHLINALKTEPKEIECNVENNITPTLPFGTIRYSSNETKTRERITMEIPKKIWDIRYGKDNKFYQIGFPRMVAQYLVEKLPGSLRVVEMKIYAVEENRKPIDDDTPLYVFPYPNVNKSNGNVCWGQNNRMEINSLLELERVFFWFISAPFNEDFGVSTTLGILHFSKLLEVNENKPFDDEWLVPANINFGDLI